MQAMKAEMVLLEDKEREEWELGARGNWRRICGMMDRAREILGAEREAAKGILPTKFLRDKKGLGGVAGTNFEPLGPALKERAERAGYVDVGSGLEENDDKMENGVDGDGDSEMEDVGSEGDDLEESSSSDSDSSSSSDSDMDDNSENEQVDAKPVKAEPVEVKSNGRKASVSEEEEVTTQKKPVPVDVKSNGRKASVSETEEKKEEPIVEPNSFFYVDTEPMPMRRLKKPSLAELMEQKKRVNDPDYVKPRESKRVKQQIIDEMIASSQPQPELEVEKPVENGDKKSKKRDNEGDVEVKKFKKSKKEKTVKSEPEPEPAAPEPASEPEPPKKSKKRSHSDANTEIKNTKKHKSTTITATATEPEIPASTVDFAEVERKLQAEVNAGEAAKAAEKAKKKRRRSSEGTGDERGKKVKKERIG